MYGKACGCLAYSGVAGRVRALQANFRLRTEAARSHVGSRAILLAHMESGLEDLRLHEMSWLPLSTSNSASYAREPRIANARPAANTTHPSTAGAKCVKLT